MIDQHSLNSSDITVPASSHYASVSVGEKSFGAKHTVKHGTKKVADKENIETVLSLMANDIAAATQFGAT